MPQIKSSLQNPTPSSGYRNGRLQYRSFGKRSRPTLSRDLDSAVKLLPPEALRTDVMNMEDDDGLDICKEITAPVYSCFCSLFPEKLLLPGTLRLGPLSHVDTFFVDCGADDLFMDSKLAADLQIPLLELSTPITLRLADGGFFFFFDSSGPFHSNCILEKHVETATFYVTDLCHGFILGYSWLERHNPRINWVSRMVEFDSSYCLENCCDGSSRIQGLGKPPDTSKTFDLPLAPDTIPAPTELSPISCSLSDSISLESMQSDVYPFVEVSPVSDASVPSDILSSFSSLFSEDQAETLPPHRNFDCSIDLKPGSEPFHGKIYQLTREEDKVMQEWIKDNLRKGFIRNSSSPHGAPCFFVKQKDKLRLCMDYRGRRRVQDFFYHEVRTVSKFLVMPFGLANAPAQFQRMMNSLFRDVIGKHVLVYLDDIVIYSDNMSDHIAQVQMSFEFTGQRTLLQGREVPLLQVGDQVSWIHISADGLRMDPSKISAVQSWPTPKKVRDLQVLLGFTNFYRALIHDYSSMTANLTKLFKKDAPFVWGPEQEKSLQDLKTAVCLNRISLLIRMIPGRLYWRPMHRIMRYPVYSASTMTLILFADCFLCAPMNSAEQNYEIYDKELLAVVESFQTLAAFPPRWSPSCHRLVRPQELRVLHDDQEINSSSGSLVFGIVRVRLLAHSSTRQTQWSG
ncbi:hypothetical protein BASA81_018410 [Batrachochytrium salamandrivorans]|nr:hypothetical protein BASA81_018410 [Batrachochytrium salamandrivorans]